MNSTTALRNRVYRDLANERMAYAATRDATHRDGERYVWGDDDGIPASGRARFDLGSSAWDGDGEPAGGKRTAAIIGTCICGVLLLLGLAYLVWAGSHGMPWTR
jgi:hypothetical protein